MVTQRDLPLAAPAPSGSIIINARCAVRTEDEHRVVVVSGLPLHHYNVNDAVAEAYAMVLLVDAGYATQVEVSRAFECSDRTVRRHLDRCHDGGMTALATRPGWRAGRRRIATKRVRIIERLNAEGVSNSDIARRLGVTEKAIRKQVGPSERPSRQESLPLDIVTESTSPAAVAPAAPSSAEPATLTPPSIEAHPSPASSSDETGVEPVPVAMSLDLDPGNRFWDRMLARFGLLDDAAPVFGSARCSPRCARSSAIAA
jgi:hypothetical protein